MLKPNETCSIRCNLNNFKKNVATNEKCILRKMGLRFQSTKSNIYESYTIYIIYIMSFF